MRRSTRSIKIRIETLMKNIGPKERLTSRSTRSIKIRIETQDIAIRN